MVESVGSSEDGFTLIEAVVALMITTLVFLSVGAELVSSLRASLLARASAQASDLLMQTVETDRNLAAHSFAALAMSSTDLSGDGRLSASGSSYLANLGTATEPVWAISSGAGITPHLATVTLQSVPYTVAQYVTVPTGCAAADCRRVTVYVSWSARGQSHSRASSTIVSSASHGAQVSYTLAPNPAASPPTSVARGGTLTLPVVISNYGIQDSWTLTATVRDSGGSALTWSTVWYDDGNRDGAYQAGTDATLGGGTASSETVSSGSSEALLAVLTVPSTAATGTVTVTLTATPNLGTAGAQSYPFTVTVS